MLPHVKYTALPIYDKDERIGLESGNSEAYFLNGYKIVKESIPHEDNRWHLYYLPTEPEETNELAAINPVLFKKMLSAYQDYAKRVGAIQMLEGYSAEREVGRKSLIAVLRSAFPYLLTVIIGITMFMA